MLTATRSALISGASSALGLACTRHLVEAGYAVTITGRGRAQLEATAAHFDGRVSIAVGEPSSRADTTRIVADHINRCGSLDLVIAEAGFCGSAPAAPRAPEHNAVAASSLLAQILGPALLCRAADQALRASLGRIILIGGIADRGEAPGSAESITRHAMAAIIESIRSQYVGSGVLVTLLQPGVNEPDGRGPTGRPLMLSPVDVGATVRWLLDQTPLDRPVAPMAGTAESISDANVDASRAWVSSRRRVRRTSHSSVATRAKAE